MLQPFDDSIATKNRRISAANAKRILLRWGKSLESIVIHLACAIVSAKPPDPSSDQTSLTLVGRVQANEEAAWQRLVDLYGPLIFSWGCRGGLSVEDSADVMQEVFACGSFIKRTSNRGERPTSC